MTRRTSRWALAALSLALAACGGNDNGSVNNPNPTTFTLTVTSTGGGVVTSAPAGISCGTDCSEAYASGTVVALTATADTGKVFQGWSGACTGTGACSVTMNADTSVTATFGNGPAGSVSEVIALTTGNRIISFTTGAPEALTSNVLVAGLQTGESLRGIDVRPADGKLYALGSSGRLYVVNPATGAIEATRVLAADATDTTAPFTALDGDSFGVDFNPVVDRLRVVSNTGQNLRINPADGAVTTDTALTAGGTAAGDVTAAAYSNNFPGATGTLLYVIRHSDDKLYLQNPANDGTLTEVGALGVDVAASSGFDVSGSNFDAMAILKAAGATVARLYTVNLGSGALTTVGAVGTTEDIVGMTRKTIVTGAAPTGDVFALAAPNQLINFNRATPGTIITRTAIAGLQSGENLIGMDFRPRDGLLYGITTGGRLVTINTANGLASVVATLAGGGYSGLSGTNFGIAVSPVKDRDGALPQMRVISSSGQNLLVSLNAADVGAVTPEDGLNAGRNQQCQPIGRNATAAAYLNDFRSARTTTLYVIDTANDVLATQHEGASVQCPTPGTTQGQLTNVGGLQDAQGAPIDAEGVNGFDIDGYNGQAFAALSVGGVSRLYRVTLGSGALEPIGAIGGGAEPIRAIALRLPSNPVVYGVTEANRLVSFSPDEPGTLLSDQAIAGLDEAAEQIVGIDYRVADRKLFGVSSNGKIYEFTLPGTAESVTATRASVMTPSPDDPTAPFSSFGQATGFGVDFNPLQPANVAALRTMTDEAMNLRSVVPTGETFSDADLSGPLPFVTPCETAAAGAAVAGAYSNNFIGSTATELFVIDSASGCLFTVDLANGGMSEVGPVFGPSSQATIAASAGFDIVGGHNGLSLAALNDGDPAAQSELFRMALSGAPNSTLASEPKTIGTATTGLLRTITIVFSPVP